MANMLAAALDMSVDESGRLCQFSKTKLCKFHVIGKCTKGEQCSFAHENLDLRKLPDLRCTKLCKTLIQTGHCTNRSCMYAHSKEELRSTGAFHKTKLCRFMQTGHCTLGAKCNFAHSSVELREPETIDILDAPPGLDWNSMLGGMLSDEEDDPAQSLTPAYVRVPGLSDSWKDSAARKPEASPSEPSPAAARGRGRGRYVGAAAPAPPRGAGANVWQSQFGQISPSDVVDFHLGEMQAYYAAEGDNCAYGGAHNDWTGAWAGSPIPEYYTSSLFGHGGSWDWRAFGNNVVVDQEDEMKVESQGRKLVSPVPKMRSVRTSESTMCTLGDTTQA